MDQPDIERLKREWTNRRVNVTDSASTLRRFHGHLGTVMTVNMNARALVRFDGTADIGWYDIPISDLTIAATSPAPAETIPPPPGQPPVTSTSKPEARSPASQKPTDASKSSAKAPSILELARRQGAAKP